MTPLFRHDCTCCKFLGHHTTRDDNKFDLYFCTQSGFGITVIARYGDEGEQYVSGMTFADMDVVPELAEAKRRAIEAGFMPWVTP